MNRMTRSAVAAALAVGVALGVTAPATSAAPRSDHAKVAKAQKGAKHDRSLSPLQRRLAKKVARKDAYLGRVAGSHKVLRLDESLRDAVVTNIEADQGELAELKTQVAAGEGLRELAAEVRGYRVQHYRRIANQLRRASGLQDDVEGMPEASVLADLIADLMTYDANGTTGADLRAAQRIIASVKEALEEQAEEEPTEPTEPTEPVETP